MALSEDINFNGSERKIKKPASGTEEPGRPFRLVKYFSLTGFSVILIFTLAISVFISHQAKVILEKKSDDYALLLADNLNHQVFLQFVIPSALRFGRIRLKDTFQFNLLDTVVRGAIHSFNIEQVNIYDLEGNITYSTNRDLVGDKSDDQDAYRKALDGGKTARLIGGPVVVNPLAERAWTLKTFSPFRAEKPVKGAVGDVLGVFEIHQDLTDEYMDISRFQIVSVSISLIFSSVLFFILRRILVRGERIIDERNEEQRRLEEKLFNSQKLATLGQMVAAVSHEIRNPLGIISSTGEILQNKIRKYEPDNKLADVIVEESKRLNGIVTEFLDFARPQIPGLKKCRVEDVLDKIIDFLEPALQRDRIDVIKDYNGPETIEADPDLLYRAFLNIFVNSLQAMPDGGAIMVKTSRPYGEDGRNLGLVEIVVEDTGEGIDPEKAKSLFNPFFTTKNRGTGLGLAIVKNIVDGHDGTVGIEPGEQCGARVVFRLPVQHEEMI